VLEVLQNVYKLAVNKSLRFATTLQLSINITRCHNQLSLALLIIRLLSIRKTGTFLSPDPVVCTCTVQHWYVCMYVCMSRVTATENRAFVLCVLELLDSSLHLTEIFTWFSSFCSCRCLCTPLPHPYTLLPT
jgi:hypothetical protein